MIPYSTQNISTSDIKFVSNTLKADFLTQGPEIGKFEEEICEISKAKYSLAVNSATSALHLACLSLGLGPGDYFWTSPNSFVSSANCGLMCGAKVDFVDINPKTYNMSTQALESKLIEAEKVGRLPKVVIPVHFAGQSCDMKKINELSKKYKFKIIEDASHALGASYMGYQVGSCKYSDISVFSFHAVKIITTGEGGSITTQSKEIFEKIKLLRSHGITRDFETGKALDEPWVYKQQCLGYNYRITDFQASLGISQLSRLEKLQSKRLQIFELYQSNLNNLPVIFPYQDPKCKSSFHLYPLQIDINSTSRGRLEIFNLLRKKGIGVNVHYIPIHTQPFYREMGFKEGDYPNAENYYARAISLPIFPNLTLDQQKKVIKDLHEVIK